MMSSEKKLFELLKEFSVFAGNFALPHYGKVEKQVKNVQVQGVMSESSVTIIDHAIQEMLLAELVRNGHTDVSFNGEEDTHLQFFFPHSLNDGTIVHCDPIDGTEGFITGNGRFAVGLGLSHAKKGVHRFTGTVVYAPLEKTLYWSHNHKASRHKKNPNPPKTISFRRSLTDAGLSKVEKMGYTIFRGNGLHLTLIDVILGKIGASIPHHTHVHDSLVPYSFARNYGIIPTDFQGNELKTIPLRTHGKTFERVPEIAYFASDEIRDELLPILSNPKYVKK